MNILRLCAPSKTFLLGEYAVLTSGQSLLLATDPGFELQVSLTQLSSKALFLQQIGQADNSPAAVLWGDVCPEVKRVCSPGKGFGSSSAFAWFALLYSYYHKHLCLPSLKGDFFARSFERIKGSTDGVGSGADIACQYYAGVTITDLESSSASRYRWPFSEVDFVIVQTGVCFSTPKHIAGFSMDTRRLQLLTKQGIAAFEQADLDVFLQVVRDYQAVLSEHGLLIDNSSRMLATLKGMPGYLAAKACGAMGAETIVVLFERACRSDARTFLAQQGITVHSYLEQLSMGLSMDLLH